MEVDDFDSNDETRVNRDQSRKMSIGDNSDDISTSFTSGFNSLLAAETVQSITGGKKAKSSTKESSQRESRRKSTEMNVETDNRPPINNNPQSSQSSQHSSRGYRYFHLPTTNPLISMNQSSTQSQSQSPTNTQPFQSKFDQFQHRRSFITPSMFGGRFRHLQSLHSEANFLGLNSIHRCLGSLPVGCVFRYQSKVEH